MRAHEIEVFIPEDHRLVVDVPEGVQTGPAKLILLQSVAEEGNGETRKPLRLDDLPKRDGLNCSFDELVETSWEHAWSPDS